VLFHREDCYKVEWSAKHEVFIMMSIEHYRLACFDTEYLTFFEAVDLLHKTKLIFSTKKIDESGFIDSSSKSVTITETEVGLNRLLTSLFRDHLGVDDVSKISDMVDDTISSLIESEVH